jgi:hypothetical protein
MRTSAFSKITAALVEMLRADPPLAEVVYRARSRVVPEKAATAINVQFNGALPSASVIAGAPIDWVSKFSIECLARGSVTVGSDEAMDPLLLGVFDRIAADRTLGGLVDDIGEPMIEADYSAEGEKTGWVCLTYPVEHRTQNSTLE